jgi:hypothetical protein
MPIGSAHWVQEGMLSSLRLHRHGTSATLEFDLRNQFFHAGRPLGWIEEFRVEIDGAAIAPGRVDFVLDGFAIPSDRLPLIADIWWQPLQTATIRIADWPADVRAQYTVACLFELPVQTMTPLVDRRRVLGTSRSRLEETLPVRILNEGDAP